MKNLLLTILMVFSIAKGFAVLPDTYCVKQGYTQDIGVREATGQNDGIEVEKYLATTGLGKGFAWCAAFVNYHLTSCGVETPKSPAWSPSWFTANVIYHKGELTYRDYGYKRPRSGDVFGIYFKSKQRIAHVGFVDQWPTRNRYLVTVEGNTNKAGSREGDGVYRKYRLKSQVHKISRWTGSSGIS
ncbi:CHAP domain-containing protein [Reichenbachiella sp.]|uniref:CHAP domain-containing protein n=1 Tax=Reichenbachiella sp. TaxID=2184521 RepID=UPI003B5CF1F6